MVERKFGRLSISEQKEMVSQLVKFVDNEVSRYFDVKAVAGVVRKCLEAIMFRLFGYSSLLGKRISVKD